MKTPMQQRHEILEINKRVRDGIEPHRHPKFARHMFRIPEGDFYALRKLFPALASKDPLEATAAWEAFEKSPFSEAYRVGRIHRGIVKNGLIGVPSNDKE